MPKKFAYDAVVIGSGPNGLAAAIRLAQAQRSVLLLEAQPSLGGGLRSAELTLPGFVHDVCSAVHPLALGSPFFKQLALERFGLKWIQPELPLAHPLEDQSAAVLYRSVDETASHLGPDAEAYRQLFAAFVSRADDLCPEILRPLLHWPRHPLLLARFGLLGARSAAALVRNRFQAESARALFAGLAAHSFLPLQAPFSASFGLVLGLLGHAFGWPFIQGGSQNLAKALAAHLRSLGGEIVTHAPVKTIDQLPTARAILLDVTPRQLIALAGHKLPSSYRRRLERFRYGPGIFKLDYALSQPIPWSAAACRRAGTVHVGGNWEDVATSEFAVAQNQQVSSRPFLLVTQPTLFDATRCPPGKHIAWVYCHVPNGSNGDLTDLVESQLERFAPGFRDCVLARHRFTCADVERHNANLVGGDINGGAADARQLIARPILSPTPYRIPVPGLYLCSASTPPGGGVHGMCGFHAAEAVLHDGFR
jgi:phytoene dehydrogenase-like protein